MTTLDTSNFDDDQWLDARKRALLLVHVLPWVGLVILAVLTCLSAYLAAQLVDGSAQYPMAALILVVIDAPIVLVMARRVLSEQKRSNEIVATMADELADAVAAARTEAHEREAQAGRQQFESRLANALDMADGEPEVIDVIERSFAATLPASRVELLLADNSRAHLLRMASSSPDGIAPGCSVDSPDRCPAARRAQVQRFADSEALDACPKLRGRSEGPLAALCLPVSIMGRTVGVIHATGDRGTMPDEGAVQDLETLAKLSGARLGLLRVMAETQLQASVDTLTGLLNRRSFEQQVERIRKSDGPLVVAMCDLDRFKELNDTYGHPTGDRALRLVAQVMRDSLRSSDVISRHGGEEFVIALPGCTAEAGLPILATLRTRLEAAITAAGLPSFTISIGVIEALADEDLQSMVARADAALFQAKRDGRDRIVVHDMARHVIATIGGRETADSVDGAAQIVFSA